MPVYEFQCHKCGHIFPEVTLSAKQAEELGGDLRACPKCQAVAHQIFSLTANPVFIEGSGGFSKPTVREPEHWSGHGDHEVINH